MKVEKKNGPGMTSYANLGFSLVEITPCLLIPMAADAARTTERLAAAASHRGIKLQKTYHKMETKNNHL